MLLINRIIKHTYFDSATLMLVSSKIALSLDSSKDIAVMMGSQMNKEVLKHSGLLNEDGEMAGAGDIIIAARVENEEKFELIFKQIHEQLQSKVSIKNEDEKQYLSVEGVLKEHNDIDFAVVSLPGEYAAREVKKLLKQNINVLLFSDNVSLEDEIELKQLAIERDLLMMGPDCGTAMINGVGLGFSNKVKKGDIGVVAASGTGLQEFVCLVSNEGFGISDAYGTGGRDLSDDVGGKMMLQCLKRLKHDDDTDVIVILSKPPSVEVGRNVLEYLKDSSKKVYVCFLGLDSNIWKKEYGTIVFCHTITQLADRVIQDKNPDYIGEDFNRKYKNLIEEKRSGLHEEQKYIRGLYCGGTLASEAVIAIQREFHKVYSNVLKDEFRIGRFEPSKRHSIIDLGDDEFTKGKVHPMIDPSLRWDRLCEEVSDSTVAVVLLDLEIGYGSHKDPASILVQEVKNANKITEKKGRQITFICSICGSVLDEQGYFEQEKKLTEAGVIITRSNDEAVRLAIEICK